jgi:hypothetical protein
MKKPDLKKLALLGITGGVMLSAQCQADSTLTAGLSTEQLLAAQSWNQGRCGGHRESYGKQAGCGSNCGGSRYKESYGREASCGSNGCGAETNDPNQANGWQSNDRWQRPSNQQQQRGQMYNSNYGQYESKETTNIQSLPQANKNSNRNRLLSQTEARPSTMQSKPLMTETELRVQLSEEGRRTFDRLDADGKKLALKLANQPDQFQNLDEAVQAAAKKMDEKRTNMNTGSQTNYRTPAAKSNNYSR